MSLGGFAVGQHWSQVLHARSIGQWDWSLLLTLFRPPLLMRCAWRVTCLCSGSTWISRSPTVRTGNVPPSALVLVFSYLGVPSSWLEWNPQLGQLDLVTRPQLPWRWWRKNEWWLIKLQTSWGLLECTCTSQPEEHLLLEIIGILLCGDDNLLRKQSSWFGRN